jgi:hypothetical protein
MSDAELKAVQSAWVARAVGVLQVLGGALETAGGVGLLLVPEPTFLTKAGGTILIGHSADAIVAAARPRRALEAHISPAGRYGKCAAVPGDAL